MAIEHALINEQMGHTGNQMLAWCVETATQSTRPIYSLECNSWRRAKPDNGCIMYVCAIKVHACHIYVKKT